MQVVVDKTGNTMQLLLLLFCARKIGDSLVRQAGYFLFASASYEMERWSVDAVDALSGIIF